MSALSRLFALVLAGALAGPAPLAAKDVETHPGANALVRELRRETAADAATVKRWRALLREAKKQDSILAAISRPAEQTKPWKDYRPIFLTAAAVVVGAVVILFDPIFQGLAISLIFGTLAATLLTLVVVPLLYAGMQAGAPPPTVEEEEPSV